MKLAVMVGFAIVLLGIGVWGAGLLMPGGVFHHPMHMVVGMILLSLGGMVAGGFPNTRPGRVRTQQ